MMMLQLRSAYRAFFIGWQEHDGQLLFPLFNINDPASAFHSSTVGLDRLRAEGMSVDEIRWTAAKDASTSLSVAHQQRNE